MEALLKASEASALMGLSVRHVQRMAKSGELPYQTHVNERNRPEYLFPLSSLPDAAQQKYFAEHAPAALPAAAPAKAKKADKPAACKPLEAYTAEERGEIGYWITTVDRWQTYRNKAGTKKAECDEKFVLLCRMEEPDRQISVETLYRKWAAIREGDYGALVDMRGKARKGMSKMPEAIERVFLSLFLDESQLPVPRCIALTEEWAQQNMPEAMPLPGYHTFYRKPVRVGRRGVTLKLHGLELDFYTPELVNMRMKEKVYVRYDPEDLSSVRVYDMEDRFLCVAPQNKLTAGYLENQEQIADLMAAKRRAEKAVREYGAALRLPDDPDRALTLWWASSSERWP